MGWGARHAGTAVAGFARAHCRSDQGWKFDARGGGSVFREPVLGDQIDGAGSGDRERGAGPLRRASPAGVGVAREGAAVAGFGAAGHHPGGDPARAAAAARCIGVLGDDPCEPAPARAAA